MFFWLFSENPYILLANFGDSKILMSRDCFIRVNYIIPDLQTSDIGVF